MASSFWQTVHRSRTPAAVLEMEAAHRAPVARPRERAARRGEVRLVPGPHGLTVRRQLAGEERVAAAP